MRVTGSSPLRGSSPITRIPKPEASQSTYRIRWPSTSIIGWLHAVVGEATLRAAPDEAILLVTLSALRDTPGPALEDVAHRATLRAGALDEISIPAGDRSTTGVSVREDFEHTQDGRRSLGHQASSTVAIRLADIKLIGQLITRVTTELDARVDGPRWQIASDNPVRLEAARQAAADGRHRAQAYAEGVGAQLGELVGLAEPETPHVTRRQRSGWIATAASGDMPIEAGEQEVTAAIEVTYVLTS